MVCVLGAVLIAEDGVINAAAKRTAGREAWPMGALERFAFYERAKRAYAVVVTGERRFYGCFLLTKGVIAPDIA